MHKTLYYNEITKNENVSDFEDGVPDIKRKELDYLFSITNFTPALNNIHNYEYVFSLRKSYGTSFERIEELREHYLKCLDNFNPTWCNIAYSLKETLSSTKIDVTFCLDIFEGEIYLEGNYVDDIIIMFPKEKRNKAIYLMNEYGAIDGRRLNSYVMEEIFLELGLTPPQFVDVEGYEVI